MKTSIGSESARKAEAVVASAMAADTLLLLRLVISDGKPDLPGLALLRHVARSALCLDDATVDLLMPSVEAFGVEDTERAANLFRQRPNGERIQLAGFLMAIARRDETLSRRGKRLRGRVAAILDLDEAALGD